MPRFSVSSLPLLAAMALFAGAAIPSLGTAGCPVLAATGWKCPGCGARRALLALMAGDLPKVFYWNALWLPAIVGLAAAGFWARPWPLTLGVIAGLAVAFFTLLRNLDFYLLY